MIDKILGAVFDFDGTLIDSTDFWKTAGTEYLLSRGLKPPADIQEKILKLSLDASYEYFRDFAGLKESLEEYTKGLRDQVFVFYEKEVQLKPGALIFLQELYRRGVKMCIATAGNKECATAAVQQLGLAPYISAIITCSEAGAGKDKPNVYNRAHEILGTPKENTFIFEDVLHAVETAKKAGFKVISVYDEVSSKDELSMRELSERYVYQLSELL